MITEPPVQPSASRWNAFWFTTVPPNVYAILRMLFGLAGLISLVGLGDLPLFWSCNGLVASSGSPTCAAFAGRGLAWVPGGAILAFAGLSFLAMLIGYRTRFAVCFAFASVFLIARWNDLPLSAAHQVLRAVLFCLIWADCGAIWSVDSWLARRNDVRGATTATQGTPIWPLQLLRIQVAAVYLVTALWKINNVAWQDGSALHYVFENPQFRRFAFLASPTLDAWTTGATYVTLAWELAFAFLVLHPRTRRWAIIVGILMHLGMWTALELGPFSWVMLASYVAFVDPESLATRLASVRHPRAAATLARA